MRKYLIWLKCHKEYISGTFFGIAVALIFMVIPWLLSPSEPSQKITAITMSKGIASVNHQGDVVFISVELPNSSIVKIKNRANNNLAIDEVVCVLQNTSFFGLNTYTFLKKGSCE